MSVSKLTQPAQDMVNAYVNLSTKGHNIPCPYYNNKHQKVRGALRVLVGKGSPSEIVQEAHMIALRKKVDLASLAQEDVRKFLVKHNLGVDCSAFVYYVLNAELQTKKSTSLPKTLNFPKTWNILRKILRRLRTAENTNVAILANEKNSTAVPLSDAQPGDMVIMLETGQDHARNHVLLIHEVDKKDNKTLLKYTHALQWRTDGVYEHGVRQGSIEVTNTDMPLTSQIWTEKGVSGDTNETFARAKRAKTLELRRLNKLSS